MMMMMMMMMNNRNHNPNPNSYSNICDGGLFRLRGVAGLQISTSFSLYSGMNSKLSLHTTHPFTQCSVWQHRIIYPVSK